MPPELLELELLELEPPELELLELDPPAPESSPEDPLELLEPAPELLELLELELELELVFPDVLPESLPAVEEFWVTGMPDPTWTMHAAPKTMPKETNAPARTELRKFDIDDLPGDMQTNAQATSFVRHEPRPTTCYCVVEKGAKTMQRKPSVASNDPFD